MAAAFKRCLEQVKERASGLTGRQKRRSYGGDDDDEKESPETIAYRMGLIAPEGKRKVQWDWFVLLLCLYTSITVPFTITFYAFNDPDINPAGFVLDILINICYIVDIFISWRTTYYDREGILVVEKKLVRRKYINTWFFPDVIASFPYEYVGMVATIGSDAVAPPALALPSMIKTLRVFRLGKKIDRLSSGKMFRIFQFTFMLLMFAHWYACIWFWAGQMNPPGEDGVIDTKPGENGTTWVYRLDFGDETIAMKYTGSLYWSLTTLMKSPWFHPNAPGEFIGASLMIIVGCVLFAYFIGNVTAVITAANAAGGRYRGQIAALKGFCTSNGIDAKMTAKLLSYQDAMWTETNGGTDRGAMMKGLPSHLLPQVAVQIYRPLLDACPFLYDCTASGAIGFLTALNVQVCNPDGILMKAGSVRRTMYILTRGEVKVDWDDDPPKETLEDYVDGGRIGGQAKKKPKAKGGKMDALRGRTDRFGTLLGFQDVFKPLAPLKYSVKAMTRVAVLSITRGQLKDLLTTYTDDKPIWSKAIEHADTTIQGGKRRASDRQATMKDIGAHVNSSTDAAENDKRVSSSLTTEENAMINGENMDALVKQTTSNSFRRPSISTTDENGEPSLLANADLLAMASNAHIEELNTKIDTLTKLAVVQAKMMKAMTANGVGVAGGQGVSGGGNSGQAFKEYGHELDQVINKTAVLMG